MSARADCSSATAGPRGSVGKIASTAFRWAQASWDNASRRVQRLAFRSGCGREPRNRALAARLRLFSLPSDAAELLHHAEVITLGPVFHHPPPGDAHDVDEPNRHPSAGRGDAHELALVGAVER